MIPLKDLGPPLRRGTPVTIAVLVLNVLVLLGMQGPRFDSLTRRYALVPGHLSGAVEPGLALVEVRGLRAGYLGLVPVVARERVSVPRDFDPQRSADAEALLTRVAERFPEIRGLRVRVLEVIRPALPSWLTLITSIFMHGGWMHLLGNMIFLFVFGRRLEDEMGTPRFLAFYLLCGVLAGLGHVISDAGSPIPTVGASGAIAGLLGGYLLLHPNARILTLVPIFFILQFLAIPAWVFGLVWVAKEFLRLGNPGMVAVWAHLVGFAYGMALVRLFAWGRERARFGRPTLGRRRTTIGQAMRRRRQRHDDLDWW